MSDQLMRLDEHRPVADGSRPLLVGPGYRTLTAELLDGAPRECWSVGAARYFRTATPQHCRLRIVPGEHYILWTEQNAAGRPTGRTAAYCAPCAIAEWRHADVREVAAS